MLRFFAARAGWFVLAACILLPLTIVAWLAISTTAGISAFYHPLHQGAPINRFEIQAVNIALAANFIAAIASSILLALKFRLAASAVVVGCWSLFLVASTGARLLVKPTPSAKFMMVCCKPAGLNRNLKSDRSASMSSRLCVASLAACSFSAPTPCGGRPKCTLDRPPGTRSWGALGGLAPKHRGSTYAHSNGKRQMSNA